MTKFASLAALFLTLTAYTASAEPLGTWFVEKIDNTHLTQQAKDAAWEKRDGNYDVQRYGDFFRYSNAADQDNPHAIVVILKQEENGSLWPNSYVDKFVSIEIIFRDIAAASIALAPAGTFDQSFDALRGFHLSNKDCDATRQEAIGYGPTIYSTSEKISLQEQRDAPAPAAQESAQPKLRTLEMITVPTTKFNEHTKVERVEINSEEMAKFQQALKFLENVVHVPTEVMQHIRTSVKL